MAWFNSNYFYFRISTFSRGKKDPTRNAITIRDSKHFCARQFVRDGGGTGEEEICDFHSFLRARIKARSIKNRNGLILIVQEISRQRDLSNYPRAKIRAKSSKSGVYRTGVTLRKYSLR